MGRCLGEGLFPSSYTCYTWERGRGTHSSSGTLPSFLTSQSLNSLSFMHFRIRRKCKCFSCTAHGCSHLSGDVAAFLTPQVEDIQILAFLWEPKESSSEYFILRAFSSFLLYILFEREDRAPNLGFLPQTSCSAKARPGQSQEPGTQSGSSTWVTGSQLFETSPSGFPKCTLAASWDKGQS